MRVREKRKFGFERYVVERATGDDAWPSLVEFAKQQSNALPPLEAEASRRNQIADRRLAYWRKRTAGVISKADEENNFLFWNRRNAICKEDWRRRRKLEVQRVADFFEWADAKGATSFPGQGVFAPGSYDYLLACWLTSYKEHKAAKVSGDSERADSLLFLLGEMSERFRWKFGKDPDTGKRLEDLAIAKRDSEAGLARARRKRHSPGYAPDWKLEVRQLAEQIWKQNPGLRNNDSRTAELAYTKMEAPKPKPGTIRKEIGKMNKNS